jgi:signal transduction histidine kinase
LHTDPGGGSVMGVVGGVLEAVAGRRTPARRREGAEAATPAGPGVLLSLLARVLDLERAAVLLSVTPGGELVPVAVHGAVEMPPLRAGEAPGGGPWSLVSPIEIAGRQLGLLAVDRGAGRPLAAAERAVAAQVATAMAQVAEHARLESELACSRELLARADRLSTLGTLAAGVAHEIRNPLVSVRTFIQLLPERLADEEFRTGFRDLALGEIERICGLINDLLSFARPAPEQREPTDVQDLVAQITRLLDAEARKHNVAVSCEADADLPLVTVDEAQVKQVLLNVLLNAIQACGGAGRVEVTISTTAQGGRRWCVLTVADSGPGIRPEHAARIFDPFFTTKDAGSGLGLFIAHQIVAGHGGYITTAPRAGGGTEFSIYFPLEAVHGHAGARTV